MLNKRNYKNNVCLFFLIMSVFCTIILSVPPCFAANLDETGDRNRLVTSNYKDGCMTIETSGDRITISGVLKENYPVSIIIENVDAEHQSLNVREDGTFSGEIVATPMKNSYYHLRIVLDSNVVYRYFLKYNNGWSVPDNGIDKENKKKFMDITSAPPIAAAYYLSADADRAEIEDTLSELQRIVDEVCGEETDDYIKAKLLINWIGENIYYDRDAKNKSVTMDTVAVHNVLELRRTTCAGFANTFSALLEVAGIRSVNLKGAIITGDDTFDMLLTAKENHEFSAFWYKDEKRWVYCDPCWTSTSYYEDGDYIKMPSGKTKYFDVTDEAFALNHRIDKVEERFYTKALAALDGEIDETDIETEEAVETNKTDETIEAIEAAEATVTTAITETAQTTEITKTNSELSPSESTDNGEYNDKEDKNGSNPTPYIIIGLIGIAVIGVGVILAVKNRKK